VKGERTKNLRKRKVASHLYLTGKKTTTNSPVGRKTGEGGEESRVRRSKGEQGKIFRQKGRVAAISFGPYE